MTIGIKVRKEAFLFDLHAESIESKSSKMALKTAEKPSFDKKLIL